MAAKTKNGLPRAAFLVADGDNPSDWHLPVKNADGSANHRLMGAAWAALHGGYRGNKYEGPNKGAALAKLRALYKREGMPLPTANASDGPDPSVVGDLAIFDLDEGAVTQPMPAGDLVLRQGKIFAAGDYPAKGFSLSSEEMRAAADDFEPVPVDIEHTESLLSGRLGELRQVTVGPDGTTLFGTVALPKWLDDALGDAKRTVSCTWDRQSKRLVGLALARSPHLSDAVLYGEYAAFVSSQTQNSDSSDGALEFAGRRHSSADAAHIQRMHDTACALGAVCAPSNLSPVLGAGFGEPAADQTSPTGDDVSRRSSDHKGGRRMSKVNFWNLLRRAQQEGIDVDFSDDDDAGAAATVGVSGLSVAPPSAPVAAGGAAFGSSHPAPPGGTPPPAGAGGHDPQVAALQAQFNALVAESRSKDQQIAELMQRTLDADAEGMARRLLAERRIMPAELEATTALFRSALLDDKNVGGQVTFARTVIGPDGKNTVQSVQGSRAEQWLAYFSSRPAHVLTQEFVPDQHGVLFNTTPSENDLVAEAERSARAYAESLNKADERSRRSSGGGYRD